MVSPVSKPPPEEFREVARLRSELKKLKEDHDSLLFTVRAVEQSLSWRITRPLRLLANLKRRIFPLLSRQACAFTVSPERSLIAEGDRFTITGPSGVLGVSVEQEIPHGWVMLDGSIETVRPHMHLLLYYRFGESFSDAHRVWLTFVDGKPLPVPFQIPRGVKGFRFDLIDNQGEFTVHRLSLRSLGSIQVLEALLAKHIDAIKRNPFLVFQKAKRFFEIWRRGGIIALKAKFGAHGIRTDYQDWVKRYDTLSADDIKQIISHGEALPFQPKFSLLMPVYNTEEKWLRAAINSVCCQTYQAWELIIVDDASTASHIKKVLEEFRAKDPRIKVFYRETNGHIALATKDALDKATAAYVIPIDHDDEISPHALYRVAVEINDYPDAKFFYSDEDKLTEQNLRFNPYFKPDWDIELLRAQNYICHLSVFLRERMLAVGSYRKGTEGAQDWDMILRYTEGLSRDQIRHIPEVLYHWRVIATSTAHSTSSKPYVLEAQRKVVSDHLNRLNQSGTVEIDAVISHMKVTYAIDNSEPLVTVIIPTRDQQPVLKVVIDGLLKETAYRNIEIIIIDNGSSEEKTKRYFEELTSNYRSVSVLRDDKPFNFSRLNNEAAKLAKGSVLAFLNNDLEIIEPHWLTEMVSLAMRPETGAVGARLLYPMGLIQHAGVITGIGGVAGHCHKGRPRDDVGYFNKTILRHAVSAVTAACLVVRKSVFDEIHGFDAENLTVAFNDVDLCLKIREKGYINIFTPFAELIHHESVSRGLENTPEKFQRFEEEVTVMKARWGERLLEDPYYNPNLTLLTEDYGFSFPPRIVKPWKRHRREASPVAHSQVEFQPRP